MIEFQIQNFEGAVVGRVNIAPDNHAVAVVIDEERHKWVEELLNHCIADHIPIVGTDGVERRIENLEDDGERRALFSKIESLSAGQLHVGCVESPQDINGGQAS